MNQNELNPIYLIGMGLELQHKEIINIGIRSVISFALRQRQPRQRLETDTVHPTEESFSYLF